RHAHEAHVVSLADDRSNGEHRAEGGTVLPHEGDLLLELPLLDGLPKEARDERRDVPRHMEHRDGHFADDLVWGPSKQVGGVRRVLLHDAVRVARDDGRLRVERLRGHGSLPGNRGTTRISGFWFTCQPSADEAPRAHGAHVTPRRPRDPERPLLSSQPLRPSPSVLFLAPAYERPDRPCASEGPVQRRGDSPAGGPRDRASIPRGP